MNNKSNDFFICIKKIIVAHQYSYKKDGIYSCLEGRNTFGLVHVLTGELEIRFLDGRILTVKSGDTFLLKPKDAYKTTCISPCEHYTVNFSIDNESIEGELCHNIFLSNGSPYCVNDKTQNNFANLLQELCNAWKEKKEGHQLNAISFLYKVLYRFIRTQQPDQYNSSYLKIKPAKDYIDLHWQENFSLQNLANLCYLSVAHFRHLFTQIYKISPIEYRNSLRLLHAKDYLAQPQYSITEVAYKCGFEDVNYFSRFFKAHTGISPKKHASF